MDEPVELSQEKCAELLSGGIVGRVAFCTPGGPKIIPVNYSVVDGAIVLRTARGGIVEANAVDGPVAFEVDHVDYATHSGWSVVAEGRAEVIDDPVVVDRIQSVWAPRPWAGGERDLYVRLAWSILTGRRLGRGWTHASEMPVRRTVDRPHPR